MTDFRLVCCLHAYSGGTVPDSNRIHYSPLGLRNFSGTQMLFDYGVSIPPQWFFVNSAFYGSPGTGWRI